MSNTNVWFGDVEVIIDMCRGGPPRTRTTTARVYIENDKIVCEERARVDMFGQIHWQRLKSPGEAGGILLGPLLAALITQINFLEKRLASGQSSPANL